MKILLVLTSHDQLGGSGRKTGFWLEEGAARYFVFRDAGVELTLASPKGGQPPIDPKSDLPENQTPAMARFKKGARALKDFARTVKLADVKAEDFDTIFYTAVTGRCETWPRARFRSLCSSLSIILASQSRWSVTLPVCSAMSNTRASLWSTESM